MNYTKRQHTLLKFIVEYQRTHEGLSPTLGEMADHMSVSKVTVFEHLATLKAKGAISTERRKSRSVRVLDPDFGHVAGSMPLLGRICAGTGIEALPVPETFAIEEMLPAGPGFYVLEVQGPSMMDEGIHDGDYVFVRDAETADNGETVVAVYEDADGTEQATLKKFYREGGRIRLQAANPEFAPIFPKACTIRGVVVGVYRKV